MESEDPAAMLRRRLEEAAAKYSGPWPDTEALTDTDTPFPQREAAAEALAALKAFAQAMVPDANMRVPLALLGALEDAEKVRRNPFLTPRPSKGGRPKGDFALADSEKLHAAVATTLLIRGGMSEVEAERKAARVLGMNAKTFGRWRANMSGRDELTRGRYQECLYVYSDMTRRTLAEELGCEPKDVEDTVVSACTGERMLRVLNDKIAGR